MFEFYMYPCLGVLQLESLSQSELASRLTLNCQNSYVEPHKIKDVSITIIDVGNDWATWFIFNLCHYKCLAANRGR